MQNGDSDWMKDVQVEAWTSDSTERARAIHTPTGLVAEASGPSAAYAACSRLNAMVTAQGAPFRYTTLTSSAAAADDTIFVNAPVAAGSWILVSPRSGHTERLPVYSCFGCGPYTVLLGIPNPALRGPYLVARLAEAHPAGDLVEVCD
jgi:hypothetical protein